MRIVLLGAPGSGKGTQTDAIIARYGVATVATGELSDLTFQFRPVVRRRCAISPRRSHPTRSLPNPRQILEDSLRSCSRPGFSRGPDLEEFLNASY